MSEEKECVWAAAGTVLRFGSNASCRSELVSGGANALPESQAPNLNPNPQLRLQISSQLPPAAMVDFPLLTALGFLFLTFNSGMAIYRSNGGGGSVVFAAVSYLDLVALFGCLRYYERLDRHSPKREIVKAGVWGLTTFLTVMFSYKLKWQKSCLFPSSSSSRASRPCSLSCLAIKWQKSCLSPPSSSSERWLPRPPAVVSTLSSSTRRNRSSRRRRTQPPRPRMAPNKTRFTCRHKAHTVAARVRSQLDRPPDLELRVTRSAAAAAACQEQVPTTRAPMGVDRIINAPTAHPERPSIYVRPPRTGERATVDGPPRQRLFGESTLAESER
ncbi:hypothetical protein U9M48_027189 [Paspalum notatum var. saurae]|uniref:Uncharacterized protein n=1 Tax=Paspalum notatum var. saurae TaxID=547442 RepID=A0AAQ3WZ90_PASNO